MMTAENGPKKKRVLLKLSGEALINEGHRGINPQALKEIAEEIADAYKCGNCELTIVLGGGNIWRGLRDGGGVGRDVQRLEELRQATLVVATHEVRRLKLDREVHALGGQNLLRDVEQDLRTIDGGEVEFDDHAARNGLSLFCH